MSLVSVDAKERSNVNTVDLYQISQVIPSSFLGIPRKQMTVLLETSSKDPLYSLITVARGFDQL